MSCGSYIHYQQDGKQATVIQPFFLFVDKDYNDYDSTRQAVVPLFSLFDNDDDDDYNDYEKQNQSWSDDKTRTIIKCNNDVYYGHSSFALMMMMMMIIESPSIHPSLFNDDMMSIDVCSVNVCSIDDNNNYNI